jgi:calcineurin-like phosphoesterase
MPGERMQVAEGEGTLCAIFIETDDATGLASWVAPLRLGGRLARAWPLPVAQAATTA